jgi:acyl-CoA synthetase (AMP-forming)/AMP-acid ligase II
MLAAAKFGHGLAHDGVLPGHIGGGQLAGAVDGDLNRVDGGHPSAAWVVHAGAGAAAHGWAPQATPGLASRLVTVPSGQRRVSPMRLGWWPHRCAPERMTGGRYHSGDLAYRDEAGFVYFAGRLGDWMRVDGENLGTAPIERVLMRYPGVIEAAVYGIPDPSVGDRVMAAMVLTDGAGFDPADFRRFLGAQSDLGPKQ